MTDKLTAPGTGPDTDPETETDPCAFDALMPRLRARARKLARSADDAEDLAQEVALKLWQLLAGDADIQAPDRYAMIMLHNLARHRWRGTRQTEELTEEMAVTAPLAPARLECADVLRAMETLPEDQADLLWRVARGETSPAHLAQATGLPLGTVMSRLARGRAKLRETLGETTPP